MDDTDHKLEFEKLGRVEITDYRVLDLRAYWTAKQIDPDAVPNWKPVADRTKAKRAFTPAQILDMTNSSDPVPVIAKRNSTSQTTVRTFRANGK